jgi:hypothetical protein
MAAVIALELQHIIMMGNADVGAAAFFTGPRGMMGSGVEFGHGSLPPLVYCPAEAERLSILGW